MSLVRCPSLVQVGAGGRTQQPYATWDRPRSQNPGTAQVTCLVKSMKGILEAVEPLMTTPIRHVGIVIQLISCCSGSSGWRLHPRTRNEAPPSRDPNNPSRMDICLAKYGHDFRYEYIRIATSCHGEHIMGRLPAFQCSTIHAQSVLWYTLTEL